MDPEQVEGSISLCRLPQGVLREQIKTTECEQSRERLKDKSLKRVIRKSKQLENENNLFQKLLCCSDETLLNQSF